MHTEIQLGGEYAQLDLTCQSPKGKRVNKENQALGRLHIVDDNTTNNQQNKLNTLQTSRQPKPFSLPGDRVGQNQPQNLTDVASKAHDDLQGLEGDGFKDLDQYSDLSNFNEIEFSTLPELDKENACDKPYEANFGSDTLQEKAVSIVTEEMEDQDGFADYVDWNDDYIACPESGRMADNEDFTFEDQGNLNQRAFPPTPSRFLQHSGDDIESSALFVRDSSEQINEINESTLDNSFTLTNNHSKLEEGDSKLKSPHGATQFSENSGSGMEVTQDIKKFTIESNSPAKQNPDTEAADVDLEWLLKEYGTCVEFI
jgi:hypothetical protein